MSRVRYEVFLDGWLLKVTERIVLNGMLTAASEPAEDHPRAEFIDGRHEWRVDDRAVAEDVARAMLRDRGLDLDDHGNVTRDGQRL